MKILIGTPIHETKDYAMEKWLKNVADAQKIYSIDLLLVDNSPGMGYVEKVKNYCNKHGIKNYKIEHLEINQENGPDERIGRSREIIRQYILSHDYDAWFSWECDQIIPTNALEILTGIMQKGHFAAVLHNAWSREIPSNPYAGFGCALIKKNVLKKYGFLLEYPNMPLHWSNGDSWFKKQVLGGGDSYIEVFGIIEPIYHLNN